MKRRILCLLALALVSAQASAATLYLEEYSIPSIGAPALVSAALAPGVLKATVAIGGTSTQSPAFINCSSGASCLIRIAVDVICSVEIGGTNPVATATSARMVAGQTEYFLVQPGDRLAVITNN